MIILIMFLNDILIFFLFININNLKNKEIIETNINYFEYDMKINIDKINKQIDNIGKNNELNNIKKINIRNDNIELNNISEINIRIIRFNEILLE